MEIRVAKVAYIHCVAIVRASMASSNLRHPTNIACNLTVSPLCIRCDTRPHYGISGGRAVYCAQHMKRGMVHLLKEQLTKEKENQSRCSTRGNDNSEIFSLINLNIDLNYRATRAGGFENQPLHRVLSPSRVCRVRVNGDIPSGSRFRTLFFWCTFGCFVFTYWTGTMVMFARPTHKRKTTSLGQKHEAKQS